MCGACRTSVGVLLFILIPTVCFVPSGELLTKVRRRLFGDVLP